MYGKFDEKTAEKLLVDLKKINPEIDILFDNSVTIGESELLNGDEVQAIFNESENRTEAHKRIGTIVLKELRPITELSVVEVREAIKQYSR